MSVSQVLGIYKATVRRNDDPAAAQRLVLLIPQVLGTAESNWAEPSDPTSVVPAIGDVVWVQFSGGDVTKPVYVATGLRQLSASVQGLIDALATAGVKDNTVPKKPTLLTATPRLIHTSEGIGSVDMDLAWTAPTENTNATALTDLQGYIAAFSYNGTDWSGGAYVRQPAVTWTIVNLLPDAQVFVRILAFDTGGNASDYATVVVTGTINPGPPDGSLLATHAAGIVTLNNEMVTSLAASSDAAAKAGQAISDSVAANLAAAAAQKSGTDASDAAAAAQRTAVQAGIDAGAAQQAADHAEQTAINASATATVADFSLTVLKFRDLNHHLY